MTQAVLLHPALSGPFALGRLARALPGPTLRPGLPGHPSGPEWAPATSYFAQALHALEAIAPKDPFHLFGHSLGGAVALAFAAHHPDRVRSLSLFEPVFFAAAEAPLRDAHDKDMAPFAAAIGRGDKDMATQIFSGLWGGGIPWEALPAAARTQMVDLIDIIPATRQELAEDSAGLLPRLPDIPCPTCIWTGATAHPIVQSIQAGLVARLPQSQGATLDHPAGHMIPVMAPDLMSQALRAFWDQLP